MHANTYISLTSLSRTRPHDVPYDVWGCCREDPAGRYAACSHHASFEGPAPATRYTGEVAVADVCWRSGASSSSPGRSRGGVRGSRRCRRLRELTRRHE